MAQHCVATLRRFEEVAWEFVVTAFAKNCFK